MILIHIIQSKFDRSIRKEWEMSLLEKEYPSYEKIISFLERFAGSLGSFQNKENSKQFYKMNKSTHSHSATFASGSSIDSRVKSCVLCKDNRHLRDKARFDQTHRASDFKVGDLVLAKTYHHPDTGKLAPFFSGPYEILEIISPQIVRIKRSNRPLSRETDTIHLAEWLPELLEAKVAAQLENPQQSQARLQSDRLRHRVKRASETPQQSQTRQEADRLRHFRQRASTWADMPNAAFHYNPALNYEQFTFLRLAIWINNAYTLIPDLPEPPEALRTLLDGFSPHSAEFMQRVRHYNNAGGLYFLDAPGGTGKTFLIILLLTKVRSTGDIALSIASSGIAATLLHGGRTAHSTFKLPLDLTRDEVPVCNLNADSAMGEVLRQCKFIIWDECTMAHRHALEAVDITLEDCRQDQRPMGGVVLLLAGDFRQILPIIPRGTIADELHACLKASPLWSFIESLTLSTNIQAVNLGDPNSLLFSQFLLQLGSGQLTDMDVDAINAQLLKEIPGQSILYTSVDYTIDAEDCVEYTTEFLNSLEPSGMPPHHLELCVGVPIILLRNIDAPRLCNGTRLCVKRLWPHVVEATILTDCYQNEEVFIPRIPLIHDDKHSPLHFKRLQFLIRVSFAISINKAQETTILTGCFQNEEVFISRIPLIYDDKHSPLHFKRLQFPIRVSFAMSINKAQETTILTGCFQNEEVFIPRIPPIHDDKHFSLHFERLQFPIRVFFAMSINKAQGQSLKIAGIDLKQPCFSHGQLYVACSRVGSGRNLYVLAPENETSNFVYSSVLS
ncbi:hypothetical protein LAZ67_4002775 [Cordylochernes scorpioides]|uniref:ATP-dependent DNA helicase n=1 Tax=Cordylochernes scorpioides TaxID=51811 RepID=A0ABY6KD33_9ARAC|nr:hypothetical protein LAZ67_4002775 [Cordylochernes scorpioides]